MLRDLRKQSKLTVDAFCARVGARKSSVFLWEKHPERMPVERASVIEQEFGKSAKGLVDSVIAARKSRLERKDAA